MEVAWKVWRRYKTWSTSSPLGLRAGDFMFSLTWGEFMCWQYIMYVCARVGCVGMWPSVCVVIGVLQYVRIGPRKAVWALRYFWIFLRPTRASWPDSPISWTPTQHSVLIIRTRLAFLNSSLRPASYPIGTISIKNETPSQQLSLK